MPYTGIKKKQSCIANDQGFVSVYALALLCIMLSFVTYCILQTQTTAKLIKQNKQHLIELYCIHEVKNKRYEPITEDISEENQEETKDDTETNIEERREYQGVNIYFQYTNEDVHVHYTLSHHTYEMMFTLDEQHEINDIQYP